LDVHGLPYVPGKKRVEVPLEKLGVMVPRGLHEELIRLIRAEGRWANRQEFLMEALREKIEREKAKPSRLSPGAERVVRETRVS
jgi:Arc/MetJ-type ribon-helix-helix transcriptional regulator